MQTNILTIRRKAILALAFVAFGYALLNISVRLLGEGFEPFTQVYLRIFLGFFIALFLFKKKLNWIKIRSTSVRDWSILTFMGIFGYSIGVYFITLGALNTKLVNVSVIFSTMPLFAFVYSLLFLKQKFNVKIIFLITLSVIGVSFIASKSFIPNLDVINKGDFYTLLAAAFFATFYIGRKLLSKRLNNFEITVLVMFIAFVTSLIFSLVLREEINLRSFLDIRVLTGLLIGSVFNIISNLFESFSFEHLNVTLGSQILLLENVFSPIFGFVLYKELLAVPEMVGAILIVISIFSANYILN